MRPSVFIGIDPGLDGAIAYYEPATGALEIFDMPTVSVKVSNSWRRRVDNLALARIFNRPLPKRAIATVEQVGGITGQSASAACVFGKAIGAVEQAPASAGIPVTEVPPGVWKKAMGLIGTDKDASRQKASKEFPAYAGLWPLVKHDGRAEAALIALYQARRSSLN